MHQFDPKALRALGFEMLEKQKESGKKVLVGMSVEDLFELATIIEDAGITFEAEGDPEFLAWAEDEEKEEEFN